MKSLNFIDLFCGCGGFSNGLEQAGHNCLLGVDFNKDAVATFARNHKNAHALNMDISKLSKKKLSEYIDIDAVDMVVGGPPCQGFSTVGKGDASDSRNSLFKQFVRIVKLTSPKIIMFENVTGMLAQKNEKTLKTIFKSFEKLGYNLDARVLSADEFGVPSRRRRAIIIGVKGGFPVFPEASKKKVNVESALKSLSARGGKIFNHDKDLARIKKEIDRKRLEHIPAGRGIRYPHDEKELLPKKLWFDVDWKQVSEGRFRQTRLQRVPLKGPAPTILTSRSMYFHPVEHRYLTSREAAKLQSFPNDFVFEGSVTAQFRQIGNAVPPMLARALGESIKMISHKKKVNLEKINREEVASKAFNYKAS